MSVIIILIYIICGLYLFFNFKRDIHIFQQNSYRCSRFWHWLNNGNIMTSWRLTDVALVMLLLTPFVWFSIIAIPLVLVIKSIIIFRKKYKKPLVFTNRVWRLYICTCIIASIIYAGSIIAFYCDYFGMGPNPYYPVSWTMPPIVALLLSIFSWCIVMFADFVIKPVEKLINKRYYDDAKRILTSMPDLKIIGITGSYGKTSTKHYLQRILSEKYETLMTPGSYNTTMGVIRTVRELMKPYHEVFICEMGAKQRGDIKEICDLVNPDMGIITAVGPMHLETFKKMENVQATKFELADAVPSAGFVVVNNDFEYCAKRDVRNTRCIRYAVTNSKDAQYRVTDIEYSAQGTTFTINGSDGFSLTLNTRLIGESNLSNLMAAVIVARELDVPSECIQQAVSRIEQVEHRLSIKKTPKGITIIDDAYNSNPVGSRMAVEALGKFTNGRRIIVTPGMIELGVKQYDLNVKLGRNIAPNVDLVIIVGEYNRQAILEGIKAQNVLDDTQIIIVDSFNEAQSFLATTLKSGDTVLYENDLPDTFK